MIIKICIDVHFSNLLNSSLFTEPKYDFIFLLISSNSSKFECLIFVAVFAHYFYFYGYLQSSKKFPNKNFQFRPHIFGAQFWIHSCMSFDIYEHDWELFPIFLAPIVTFGFTLKFKLRSDLGGLDCSRRPPHLICQSHCIIFYLLVFVFIVEKQAAFFFS